MNESDQNRSNKVQFADTLLYFEFVLISVIMITICVATIVGNTLVLLSFVLDKKLRTLTNYFLLSLAVSDMMIGTFAMPLFTLYVLSDEWTLGPALCDMWLAQDYMCSMASSLNLLMIGFDRYFSVVNPLSYRARRSGKLVAGMISCVWILSFLVWPPWIYAWQYIEGRRTVPDYDCYVQFLETNSYLTFVTVAIAYYIPVSIICVLYFRIWRETVKRKQFLVRMESHQDSTVAFSGSNASHRETCTKSLSSKLFCCCSSKYHSSNGQTSQQTAEQVELLTLTSDSKEIGNAKRPNASNECDHKDITYLQSRSSKHQSSNQHRIQQITEQEQHLNSTSTSKQMPTSQLLSEIPNEIDQTDVTNITASLSETHSSHKQHQVNENVSSRMSSMNTAPGKHDNKAARVLGAILIAFLITTTPYNVVVLIKNLDDTRALVSDAMWYFVYFMFYVNSTLNPICYALASPQFRKTYWKILTCSWRTKSTGSKSFGSSHSNTSQSKASQSKTSQSKNSKNV